MSQIPPINSPLIPLTNAAGMPNLAVTSFAQSGKVIGIANAQSFAKELAGESSSESAREKVEKEATQQIVGLVPTSFVLYVFDEQQKKQQQEEKNEQDDDEDENELADDESEFNEQNEQDDEENNQDNSSESSEENSNSATTTEKTIAEDSSHKIIENSSLSQESKNAYLKVSEDAENSSSQPEKHKDTNKGTNPEDTLPPDENPLFGKILNIKV